MSASSNRVWITALSAIIISLAAFAMSTYAVGRGIQAAPSLAATQRSLGENFNWKLGEVVDVQGNLYAYWGYYLDEGWSILRIGKWQDGWMELSYGGYSRDNIRINVTLFPYMLYIQRFGSHYLTATFFES